MKYFSAITSPKSVLDLGAGQGRDAIFIAKLGHHVHAVDLSPTGLAQLAEDARGLNVTTELANILDYNPSQKFDIILVDRVFHMLGATQSLAVLPRLLGALNSGGEVYILDEKKDIPAYATALLEAGFSITARTHTSLRARAA